MYFPLLSLDKVLGLYLLLPYLGRVHLQIALPSYNICS